jgi:hypothetical protein
LKRIDSIANWKLIQPNYIIKLMLDSGCCCVRRQSIIELKERRGSDLAAVSIIKDSRWRWRRGGIRCGVELWTWRSGASGAEDGTGTGRRQRAGGSRSGPRRALDGDGGAPLTATVTLQWQRRWRWHGGRFWHPDSVLWNPPVSRVAVHMTVIYIGEPFWCQPCQPS